jgi:hypothetical protein
MELSGAHALAGRSCYNGGGGTFHANLDQFEARSIEGTDLAVRANAVCVCVLSETPLT